MSNYALSTLSATLHIWRHAAVIAIALAAFGAQAEQALTGFDATYKVRMKGLRGEMRMSLARVDVGFEAKSSIRPRGIASLFAGGSLEESSTFVLRDERVMAMRFESRDSIARNSKQSRMEFDWDAARARGTNNDGNFEHAIDPSTYDRVSIQYALMFDLLNGNEGRDYAMLDGPKFKELEVRILGESRLKVPYGEFDVIRVQHQARNSSRATTLWCARELGYLPVRIEQHRKGKRIVLAEMTEYGS